MTATFKGFGTDDLLKHFGVCRIIDPIHGDGWVIPYRTVNDQLYREKLIRVGAAARWLGPSRPQIPYGLETLRLGGPVAFVVEGESCAWSLRRASPLTPVLGIPGASSWKPEWAPLLRRFPIIYLSFDADDAGRSLLDEVWPSMPWARRVRLPEGWDTRDVLQRDGEAVYERLLDDANDGCALKAFINRYAREHRHVAA